MGVNQMGEQQIEALFLSISDHDRLLAMNEAARRHARALISAS